MKRLITAAVLWGGLAGLLVPIERLCDRAAPVRAPVAAAPPACRPLTPSRPRVTEAPLASPVDEDAKTRAATWASESEGVALDVDMKPPTETDCSTAPCLAAWLIPGMDITDILQDQMWLSDSYLRHGIDTAAMVWQRPAGGVIVLRQKTEADDLENLMLQTRMMDLADRVGELGDDTGSSTSQ